VPYTVWSDDRLVGQSALDYVANTSEVKFGDFDATEYGEQLIAILMAPRVALCARAPLHEIDALHARSTAVKLELRAPDGRRVPIDDIAITDLEWLLTLVPPDGAEESWETDLEQAAEELYSELEPEESVDAALDDLLPPEWQQEEVEGFSIEEFDVRDLELGDADAPPPEVPRYQIQVRIANGG
jgi:hypothetical protein